MRANASQMQGKCATSSNARRMHANRIKILGSLASGTTKMRHARFCWTLPGSDPTQRNAKQMHGERETSQPNQHLLTPFFRVAPQSANKFVLVWQGF